MWGRIIELMSTLKYKPPQLQKRKNIMTPNPHYINMMINIGIFAMLVYVAIKVS